MSVIQLGDGDMDLDGFVMENLLFFVSETKTESEGRSNQNASGQRKGRPEILIAEQAHQYSRQQRPGRMTHIVDCAEGPVHIANLVRIDLFDFFDSRPAAFRG